GRFRSKDELLREAVIRRSNRVADLGHFKDIRVAELIRRGAALSRKPLTDDEAVRLEAFVTARREPDVAAAVKEAQENWRDRIQPLVDAAVADGTVAAGVDPEAVLYFVRTMRLGLLLQRAAGLPAPDASAWRDLVTRMVASFGDPNHHSHNDTGGKPA